jgi:uncharacterized membrane protein
VSLLPEERSISQLFGDSLAELAKLMQNEVELARAEMRDKLNVISGAAKLLAASAALLVPGLVLILLAVAAELMEFGLSAPLAYFCSGGIATIVALALGWTGISRLSAGALKPAATLNEIRRDKNVAMELMR